MALPGDHHHRHHHGAPVSPSTPPPGTVLPVSSQSRLVTILRDSMTFAERQRSLSDQIDRHANNELQRRQRDWHYAAQRMRTGLLRLLPVDGRAQTPSSPFSTLVTDIVPLHRVRAPFFEYSDDDDDGDEEDIGNDVMMPGDDGGKATDRTRRRCSRRRRRYQLRFDVTDLDPCSVGIDVKADVIVVTGTSRDRKSTTTTTNENTNSSNDKQQQHDTGQPEDNNHHDDECVINTTPDSVAGGDGETSSSSPPPPSDVVEQRESDQLGRRKHFIRRVAKPPIVDKRKIRAYLSTDGILTVEAPLAVDNENDDDDDGDKNDQQQRRAIRVVNNLTSAADQQNNSDKKTAVNDSATDDTAPDGIQGAAAAMMTSNGGGQRTDSPDGAGSGSDGNAAGSSGKEKIGVPIFRDENGARRMHLAVELGTMYRPHDVIVQVVKETRIQIRAKHLERRGERQSKNKFTKEYELGEKIEPFSLQGGLTANGKLIVSAYAKGHAPI